MAAETETDPALQDAAWDLDPLLDGGGEEAVDAQLDEAQRRADAFAERYAGKVAELDGPGLVEAMRELDEIQELVGRAGNYAACASRPTPPTRPRRAAAARAGARHGDRDQAAVLRARVGRARRRARRGAARRRGPGLRRHHLRMERRYRPHLLSEPEEKMLTEKAVTGAQRLGAAVRRADVGASRSRVDDGAVPLESRSAACCRPTARCAARAAERVTAALEPGLRTRAYIFNTLLADKAVDDRLRDYPTWLASRNLANEASDESVEALVDAVAGPLRASRSAGTASRRSCSASTGSPTTTAWPR